MFFSHTHRQTESLSHCISDSFYRELFMNPCLSGWNKGEEKHEYMHLCHRVLSRSQFNAVLKLREAGINTKQPGFGCLIFPISLAKRNHVSLGSLKLSSLLGTRPPLYPHHEKYLAIWL